MSRRTLREAIAGVIFILVIALLLTLSVMVYNKDFANISRVSLDAGNVGTSLQRGSDVEIRGVVVGTVAGVSTRGPDGTRISLDINSAKLKEIPSDITAQLLPKTLFGERYVSLILPPGTDVVTPLRGGDVIQQDTSPEGVEIETLFDNLLPVLQAVKPAQLSETLGNLALALQGRGDELGATLSTISDYLAKLNPKVPELTDDLQRLASVADTYTSATPDLLNALTDLTTTSRTLVDQQNQLSTLFQTVTSASDELTQFVGTNSQNIITLSKDSLPALTVLAKYSSEFPCVSKALANLIPNANRDFGAGTKQPGLHITLTVVPAHAKYVAGRDTPGTYATGAPSCPLLTPGGLSGTAIGESSGSVGPKSTVSDGIGAVNSPAEDQVIAELIAPTMGIAPSDFPKWNSLLLGPVLRGTQVTVK